MRQAVPQGLVVRAPSSALPEMHQGYVRLLLVSVTRLRRPKTEPPGRLFHPKRHRCLVYDMHPKTFELLPSTIWNRWYYVPDARWMSETLFALDGAVAAGKKGAVEKRDAFVEAHLVLVKSLKEASPRQALLHDGAAEASSADARRHQRMAVAREAVAERDAAPLASAASEVVRSPALVQSP